MSLLIPMVFFNFRTPQAGDWPGGWLPVIWDVGIRKGISFIFGGLVAAGWMRLTHADFGPGSESWVAAQGPLWNPSFVWVLAGLDLPVTARLALILPMLVTACVGPFAVLKLLDWMLKAARGRK